MTRCFNVLLAFAVVAGPAFAADALVEMEAEGWKYFDKGESPGDEWHSPEFDDSEWESGQAPLGYDTSGKEKDIKTILSFGNDEESKPICTYLRKTVKVTDLDSAKKLHVEFICDDACIVFVNGKEAHRHNLPVDELTDKTPAIITAAGEMERFQFNVLLDPALFKSGDNTVAVRLHQRGKVSSDLAFDMTLKALTSDDDVSEAVEKVERDAKLIKRAIEAQKNAENN